MPCSRSPGTVNQDIRTQIHRFMICRLTPPAKQRTSALKETSSGGLLDNAGSCSPLVGVRPGETRRIKSKRLRALVSCQSPGDARPAVNLALRPIYCAWLQGSRSRPSRSSSLCVFLAGSLCFFSLAAGEGLKAGRGARVACGMWDGARFLFSSLYSFWTGAWHVLA